MTNTETKMNKVDISVIVTLVATVPDSATCEDDAVKVAINAIDGSVTVADWSVDNIWPVEEPNSVEGR
jgi:hypothetical protein